MNSENLGKIYDIPGDYEEAVEIERYGNEVQLIFTKKGYKQWVHPGRYNKDLGKSEPIEKVIPLKITIGINDAQARQTLQNAIDALDGKGDPDF